MFPTIVPVIAPRCLSGFPDLLPTAHTFTRSHRAVRSVLVMDAAGTLFVGSDDNSVYALDSLTGHLHWSFATDGSVDGMAVDALGNLIVTSEDDNVYSLSAY